MKTIAVQTVHVHQARPRSFAWLQKVRSLVGKILFNLIPFGIVAVFFWLQAQIQSQGSAGWLTKIEFGMTVIFELGLVFIWSLFLEGK